MKRMLSRLVSRAVNSPHPTARPVSRVRLGMDLLEGRSMPSYFLPYIHAAAIHYHGSDLNDDGFGDILAGAEANGHVK